MPKLVSDCVPKTLWQQYAELQNLRKLILAMEQSDLRSDVKNVPDSQGINILTVDRSGNDFMDVQ